MTKRTPVLIFDFGNVVAFFDYRRMCEVLGRPLGLSGDALLEQLRASGFTTLVQRYEAGKITAEGFSQAVCRLAGVEVPHAEFAPSWADIFWLNEPVVDLV